MFLRHLVPAPCKPDSHRDRITGARCRKNTVVSPDDGHILARNVDRKEINILRQIEHQLDFIYKIIRTYTVNRTEENFA